MQMYYHRSVWLPLRRPTTLHVCVSFRYNADRMARGKTPNNQNPGELFTEPTGPAENGRGDDEEVVLEGSLTGKHRPATPAARVLEPFGEQSHREHAIPLEGTRRDVRAAGTSDDDGKISTRNRPEDDRTTPDERTLARLATGYSLRVRDADRTLQVFAPSGQMCVQLVLAPEGPRIELHGADLAIRTDRTLTIECDRLDLRAAHGLAIASGGDLELIAVGELHSQAFAQRHVATRGDVQLKANDDVQLDGERIRLNSPKQVPTR
jgi:hypothetical protein